MQASAMQAVQAALTKRRDMINQLLLQLCRAFEMQIEQVLMQPAHPEMKLSRVRVERC